MAEQQTRNEKNPVGAAILSAIFPGLGFFYIGNAMKAIAYIVVFASLIVLQVKGRGHEHVVYGLLIAGFYIFQIFDSFDEARKTQYKEAPQDAAFIEEGAPSLFAGVTLLAVGVIFQLAELDIIRYRDISKMWPLVLIAVGIKFIFTYARESRDEKEKENNQPGGYNE
jgi:hypothetical protein